MHFLHNMILERHGFCNIFHSSLIIGFESRLQLSSHGGMIGMLGMGYECDVK
jgi:hypothetical protein